jgi:hypothetical protein
VFGRRSSFKFSTFFRSSWLSKRKRPRRKKKKEKKEKKQPRFLRRVCRQSEERKKGKVRHSSNLCFNPVWQQFTVRELRLKLKTDFCGQSIPCLDASPSRNILALSVTMSDPTSKYRKEVGQFVRSVLLLHKNGLVLRDFLKEYQELTYSSIDFKRLGFGSTVELLRGMPHFVRVRKNDQDVSKCRQSEGFNINFNLQSRLKIILTIFYLVELRQKSYIP